MPPNAPRLAPAVARAIAATEVVPDAVTANHDYGQASVDTELAELGCGLVTILRNGKTASPANRSRPSPRSNKRQHDLDQARLRTLEGART